MWLFFGGIIMEKHFNTKQVYEIVMGMVHDIDYTLYANSPDGHKNFTASQMELIRGYLISGYDVSKILKTSYSVLEMSMMMFHESPINPPSRIADNVKTTENMKIQYDKMNPYQLEELRLGMKKKVCVEFYYDHTYMVERMRRIRHILLGRKYGRVHTNDRDYFPCGRVYDPYYDVDWSSHPSYNMYDIFGFEYIGLALEIIKWLNLKWDIRPYLFYTNPAELEQIRHGLSSNLDVHCYDGINGEYYTAMQMREIRFALKKKMDPTYLLNPLLDWKQMREIRLGILHMVDVDKYADISFPWKVMREMRIQEMENEKPVYLRHYVKHVEGD